MFFSSNNNVLHKYISVPREVLFLRCFSDFFYDKFLFRIFNNILQMFYPFYKSSLWKKNITALSLFYRHFPSKCTDKFHYLVLPFQTFTASIRHNTSTDLNQPHFHIVSNVRRPLYKESQFFAKMVSFSNIITRSCFPEIAILATLNQGTIDSIAS